MEHFSSSFSAEELNDAIDDRNFPRHSDSSIGATGGGPVVTSSMESTAATAAENGEAAKEHVNGFTKWANRPKPLDLKSAEKIFNVPGSSQTPRTSTTPGRPASQWERERGGPKLFRRANVCRVSVASRV